MYIDGFAGESRFRSPFTTPSLACYLLNPSAVSSAVRLSPHFPIRRLKIPRRRVGIISKYGHLFNTLGKFHIDKVHERFIVRK
ncbi:unnamed protein product [Linum trigynum]|uniref:Uncharacterized protein n=1 Tax=Linum trigynum TaxID=586398 RepID=A0AAV2EE99_9ROSI